MLLKVNVIIKLNLLTPKYYVCAFDSVNMHVIFFNCLAKSFIFVCVVICFALLAACLRECKIVIADVISSKIKFVLMLIILIKVLNKG